MRFIRVLIHGDGFFLLFFNLYINYLYSYFFLILEYHILVILLVSVVWGPFLSSFSVKMKMLELVGWLLVGKEDSILFLKGHKSFFLLQLIMVVVPSLDALAHPERGRKVMERFHLMFLLFWFLLMREAGWHRAIFFFRKRGGGWRESKMLKWDISPIAGGPSTAFYFILS